MVGHHETPKISTRQRKEAKYRGKQDSLRIYEYSPPPGAFSFGGLYLKHCSLFILGCSASMTCLGYILSLFSSFVAL